MTNPLTLQGLYDETLTALAQGTPVHKEVDQLTAKGLPAESARVLADEANRIKKAAFRKAGLQAAATGACYVAAGLIITGVTYSLELPIFLVAWGPVVFGGWQTLKGLYRAALG